jgi:hypothetical protein
MQLDELAREGQPEPGALHLLVRRPDLTELLEDHLLILGRDSHARVRDRNLGQAFVHRGADVDPATLGRELERVGQQVQEPLLHLALVGADRAHAAVDCPSERDTPYGGMSPPELASYRRRARRSGTGFTRGRLGP